METRHGTQLEDMRRSLEENWKRFCADLEERDARITELGQHISILSRSLNLTGNGPGTSMTTQRNPFVVLRRKQRGRVNI